jgi:hypothetical protein
MSMIIQTALVYLVSDKGGSWLAKILSEKGLFGFGSKVAKKLAHRRLQRNADIAREQHINWLNEEILKESSNVGPNSELEKRG